MLAKVDPQEQKRRYNICLECKHRIIAIDICGQCYCYLPLKTSLKSSRCPLSKWAVGQPSDQSTT